MIPRFYGRVDDGGRFYGFPFNGIVTGPFAEPRSRIDAITGETITWPHSGTDLSPLWIRADGEWVPNTNMPLRAPCPLTIQLVWDEPVKVLHPASGLGRWVWARTPEGWDVIFAHMERIDVAVGDVVPRGFALGITGTTGFSTSIHTHAMVIEPLNGLAPDWKERAGRRDYLDYLTENVDPGEAWPTARLQVGDPTPVLTKPQWELALADLYQQVMADRGFIDISYGDVVKTGRYHVELEIPDAVIGE